MSNVTRGARRLSAFYTVTRALPSAHFTSSHLNPNRARLRAHNTSNQHFKAVQDHQLMQLRATESLPSVPSPLHLRARFARAPFFPRGLEQQALVTCESSRTFTRGKAKIEVFHRYFKLFYSRASTEIFIPIFNKLVTLMYRLWHY